MGRNRDESGGGRAASGLGGRDDAAGGGHPGGWRGVEEYKGHLRAMFEGIAPKSSILGEWDDGLAAGLGPMSR